MQLPNAFEEYTKQLMGDELYLQFRKGLEEDVPVSIRLNPFKHSKINNDIVKGEIPWCKDGYYLKERPNFTFDPLFHAGVYYVQEAASMFLDQVLRQYTEKPVLALDLCAAPGGKTTCAMAALPQGSMLLSNEPIGKRAQILTENVQKFGHPNLAVTNNYPRDYKKTSLEFDVIIADVPCSGEGMFRKDNEAIGEWSEEDIEKCWRLQRSIIEDIWGNLKPGGLLIYSTCTFNAYENEKNVAWIARELEAEVLPVTIKKEWNITPSLIKNPIKDLQKLFPVYRFIPGKTIGEGLFMAVLRKKGNGINERESFNLQKSKTSIDKELKRLKVLTYGVMPSEVKGKNVLPHISEALSFEFDPQKYPSAEIDYLTAIAYLRHEAITLNTNIPKGIIRITYKGVGLGFVKNLGNRANNLYPQEWRIKSTYIPDKPCVIK